MSVPFSNASSGSYIIPVYCVYKNYAPPCHVCKSLLIEIKLPLISSILPVKCWVRFSLCFLPSFYLTLITVFYWNSLIWRWLEKCVWKNFQKDYGAQSMPFLSIAVAPWIQPVWCLPALSHQGLHTVCPTRVVVFSYFTMAKPELSRLWLLRLTWMTLVNHFYTGFSVLNLLFWRKQWAVCGFKSAPTPAYSSQLEKQAKQIFNVFQNLFVRDFPRILWWNFLGPPPRIPRFPWSR